MLTFFYAAHSQVAMNVSLRLDMPAIKTLILALILAAILFPISCARLTMKPPSVTVTSIEVVDATVFEQRFSFTLRVQNPNDIDIPLKGLSFEVELNDRPFARGVSDRAITVPRFSEELLEVTAVSSLTGILLQINEWTRGERTSISYRIKGTLSTGLPGGLNFDEKGVLELPPTRQ